MALFNNAAAHRDLYATTPAPTQRKKNRDPADQGGNRGRTFKGKGTWELSKSSKYETRHGIRRVGSEGMLNSANNNRKGEVGNNNKGFMNRDVGCWVYTLLLTATYTLRHLPPPNEQRLREVTGSMPVFSTKCDGD